MSPFSCLRDCLWRGLERKKTLLAFCAVFLLGMVLGLCCFRAPAVFEYHFNLCDRFMSRVCYSDRSVVLIWFERTAGCTVVLALVLLGGIHIAGVALPAALLLYRAYTFGGSLGVFFTVYGGTGVLIVTVLYLPIHLLTDAVLLLAASVSCGRAAHFCFTRRELLELLLDFAVFAVLILAIYLLEALVLLAVFHPLGNLL